MVSVSHVINESQNRIQKCCSYADAMNHSAHTSVSLNRQTSKRNSLVSKCSNF